MGYYQNKGSQSLLLLVDHLIPLQVKAHHDEAPFDGECRRELQIVVQITGEGGGSFIQISLKDQGQTQHYLHHQRPQLHCLPFVQVHH